MEVNMETITVNGEEYVKKSSVKENKYLVVDGLEYCIVRSARAGVFAGYVVSRNGMEVILKKARRIWYWSGAASLSQLANEGTKKPSECKFPAEVPYVVLTESIEILPVSENAKKSIDGVKEWRQ